MLIILELNLRLIIINFPITEWHARSSKGEQKTQMWWLQCGGSYPSSQCNMDNNKLAKKLVNYKGWSEVSRECLSRESYKLSFCFIRKNEEVPTNFSG